MTLDTTAATAGELYAHLRRSEPAGHGRGSAGSALDTELGIREIHERDHARGAGHSHDPILGAGQERMLAILTAYAALHVAITELAEVGLLDPSDPELAPIFAAQERIHELRIGYTRKEI